MLMISTKFRIIPSLLHSRHRTKDTESLTPIGLARRAAWVASATSLRLLMHHKYGDRTDRYEKPFRKQWSFIEKHLLDPVHVARLDERGENGRDAPVFVERNSFRSSIPIDRSARTSVQNGMNSVLRSERTVAKCPPND